MPEKANLDTIRTTNSKLILNLLRKKCISRAEISDITGLTRSAVTTITQYLIATGQIKEVGTEATAAGRAPVLLDIVKDYRYAMGILFHRKEIAVCIVNLKLECIETRRQSIECFQTPEDATDWAYREGLRILEKFNISFDHCIGIGISSPGPLNCMTGDIFIPPNFPLFHHFNPVTHLSQKCSYPIYINNAPVPMAVYEMQTQLANLQNSIFIVVDKGVGAAILQNGSIYYGRNGFSGEFGHISVDYQGKSCSCGGRGCLECYVTRNAILNEFQMDSYEEIVDHAYDGNEAALAVLEYIANHLSTAIVSTVNLLDLESVVIWGELNYRHKLLFSMIEKTVNDRIMRPKSYPITIIPSNINRKNDLAFVASIVIQNYFSP